MFSLSASVRLGADLFYEFSDFCFCVSCYSFIYLLKLNIVYYYTILGVS